VFAFRSSKKPLDKRKSLHVELNKNHIKYISAAEFDNGAGYPEYGVEGKAAKDAYQQFLEGPCLSAFSLCPLDSKSRAHSAVSFLSLYEWQCTRKTNQRTGVQLPECNLPLVYLH